MCKHPNPAYHASHVRTYMITNAIGMHPTPTSTHCTPIPFPTPPNGGPTPQHYIPSPSEAVNMPLQGGPPNGFYAAPHDFTNADMAGGTMHGGDGGIQFQCLPYAPAAPPPQMPFYYANGGMPINSVGAVPQASNGCANGGISAGPGAQGYWCQPSNALLPLPTSTPQANGSNSVITANNSNSNTTTRSRENK